MKLKHQDKIEDKKEYDGPLRMAPDPYNNMSDCKREQDPPMRPQRYWEPEQITGSQNKNSSNNNWSNHYQGNNSGYNRYALPYDRAPSPFRRYDEEKAKLPQNQKCVEKCSYHISSIGEEGEEVIEESSIYEDGFQIYHSSAYKKK